MSKLSSRYPLPLFFVLVFIVEWPLVLALLPLSPFMVGLIALVPTPVALIVASSAGGRQGISDLLRKCLAGKAGLKWYAVAVLIPVLIHLVGAALALSTGAKSELQPQAFLAFFPLTLVLATGEEIGWHGFALPRLRMRFSPLPSAITFGVVHAAFHLPMYLLPLPDEFRQASPFPLFLLMATAFAVFRVWLFEHTGGNVPLIIVYHAAINTSVLFLNGVDPELTGWLLPVVWSLAALLLLASQWRFWTARLAGQTDSNRKRATSW